MMMESAEGESENGPNWLELPRDVTANILQKLDVVEIVTSARQVCSLWWNICKEPFMWRTIVMTYPRYSRYNLAKICRYAVRQSCGHLEDINIEHFGTNELLIYIANSTSKLRRIRVAKCPKILGTGFLRKRSCIRVAKYPEIAERGLSSKLCRIRVAESPEISERGLLEIAKKFPLLEELDISLTPNLSEDFLEAIGRSCPLLKTLKFNMKTHTNQWLASEDDEAFAIAKTMPQLRHLQIMGNYISNNALLAILNGCPLLEYLDLRACHLLDLSGSLGKQCRQRIKVVRFPLDEDEISDDYSSSEINCYRPK